MGGLRSAIRDAASAFSLWEGLRDGQRRNGESESRGWGTGGVAESGAPQNVHDSLALTIEGEIIPRLLLAHCAEVDLAGGVHPGPGSGDVEEFARLVMSHDLEVAAAYVEALRARGATLESVFLDLLAPTARHFGDLWKEDAADFMAVTLGLTRLQQVLRRFSPAFEQEAADQENAGRVLLAPSPGEQHSFGVFMVEEFFRRAGWDVYHVPHERGGDLIDLLRKESYSVVGLSLSCEALIDELASCIRAIRCESRNRAIVIMVGGQLFVDHPELVAVVGADATALDGPRAVEEAHNLLGRGTADA